MGRAPCCDKANVKKGPWSPEEDAKLKSYIEKHGTGGNWIALPQKIGLKRCGKSCRLRWLNYLRPNIKHGGFSEEEDKIILSLYVSIGSRWSIIAAQLPGRTDNDIKNYWNTRLKKKLLGKQRKDHHQNARKGTSLIIKQEDNYDPMVPISVSNNIVNTQDHIPYYNWSQLSLNLPNNMTSLPTNYYSNQLGHDDHNDHTSIRKLLFNNLQFPNTQFTNNNAYNIPQIDNLTYQPLMSETTNPNPYDSIEGVGHHVEMSILEGQNSANVFPPELEELMSNNIQQKMDDHGGIDNFLYGDYNGNHNLVSSSNNNNNDGSILTDATNCGGGESSGWREMSSLVCLPSNLDSDCHDHVLGQVIDEAKLRYSTEPSS